MLIYLRPRVLCVNLSGMPQTPTDTPNGGPAFPLPFTVQTDGLVSADPNSGLCGMSLRDYFAAKALPTILAAFLHPDSAWDTYDDVAESCYKIADAILRERAK